MPINLTPITPSEDDTPPTIAEQSAAPKRVTVDGQTVEQHPLSEQIEADRYTRSTAAAATGLGVRYVKFVAPGSI